jgi:uncharacterized protein (DUF2062 family)
MSTPVVAPASPATPGREGFWRRRIVGPIRAQLTQGVSPDTIALTIGVGTACSIFPFLGFTTLLNLGAGFALRMNHPILQTLNQLLGPVQLLLILVYVRIGEVIWRATDDRFTLGEMMSTFRDANFSEFLQRFGWAGAHALTAWLVTSPLLVAAITLATRPALRRALRKISP